MPNMPDLDRPIVKLRPGKGGRLRNGAPWVFADEIAMDRRTRKLVPGTLVDLRDGEEALGLAAFNPDSQISARLLGGPAETPVDADWFAARIRRALQLRDRLFDALFYRLVHAEGDGLPGTVIDRFGDAVVIQPNAAWVDACLPELIDAVQRETECETVIVNATSRVRKLEGLGERMDSIGAELNGPVEVPMNGAKYLADLTSGQKTGLFYDQRPNHAFLQRLCPGNSML
ncbi:MAG: RlmI/RlmK family 23S rRNA methyltransferase, partial [Pseudomonadota bacterium]